MRKVEMSSSTRSAKRYSNIVKDMTKEFDLPDDTAQTLYSNIKYSNSDMTLKKRGDFMSRLLRKIGASRPNRSKAARMITRIQMNASPTRSHSARSGSHKGGSKKRNQRRQKTRRL